MLLPPGAAAATVEALWPRPSPYMNDPVGWVHDVLGEETWSAQDEILRSLVVNRRTTVRSAHAIGKSHIASRAAAWWVDSHPVDDTFLVTTAPSAPQVRGILWRYIKSAHAKGELGGYITDAEIPEWKIGGNLIGWGRKPADRVSPEAAATAFQGIHARYVLVVLDEASGIPRWLYDAITTLVTSPTNRVLAIGNPDDPRSHFERTCRPGTRWHKIKVSAFDTPAYTGEQISEHLAAHLVSREWVEAVREEWGEDSNLYEAKVLAEFPESAVDSMIPGHLVEAARRREAVDPAPDGPLGGVLALDVARSSNGDYNTIVSAYRGRIAIVRRWREPDTVKTADAFEAQLRSEAPNWKGVIDGDGVGGPVFDLLRSRGLNVVEYRGSARPRHRPDRYRNRRAEAYAAFVDQLRAESWALPPDQPGRAGEMADELALDLVTPQKVTDAGGRIGVEAKEALVLRLGRSPDLGDACIMAAVTPPDERTPGAPRPGRQRRSASPLDGAVIDNPRTARW